MAIAALAAEAAALASHEALTQELAFVLGLPFAFANGGIAVHNSVATVVFLALGRPGTTRQPRRDRSDRVGLTKGPPWSGKARLSLPSWVFAFGLARAFAFAIAGIASRSSAEGLAFVLGP